MANKPENKMPLSERAKQFLPFAALKGLPEALAEKERQAQEEASSLQSATPSVRKTFQNTSIFPGDLL